MSVQVLGGLHQQTTNVSELLAAVAKVPHDDSEEEVEDVDAEGNVSEGDASNSEEGTEEENND